MKTNKDILVCCIVMVMGLGGCFFDSGGVPVVDGPVDGGNSGSDASGPGVDGGPDASLPDAPGPDAPPGPLAHLLITEVTLAVNAAEFIEIFNPGAQAVDLTDYYLSDTSEYAKLPGQFGDSADPMIAQYDFIARFPAGASIEPGEVKVIAMNSEDFSNSYSQAPDFGIFGEDVPRMVDPDSLIDGEASLTNGGEGVVLFYWDGSSDLVSDVDMVHAGDLSAGNELGDKTGLAVDGPDNGPNTSGYKGDAYTLDAIGAIAGDGYSHKRIMLEGIFEVRDGSGNGLYGDDETSENISVTWDNGATFTAPTPGTVLPALLGN